MKKVAKILTYNAPGLFRTEVGGLQSITQYQQGCDNSTVTVLASEICGKCLLYMNVSVGNVILYVLTNVYVLFGELHKEQREDPATCFETYLFQTYKT